MIHKVIYNFIYYIFNYINEKNGSIIYFIMLACFTILSFRYFRRFIRKTNLSDE